jgi:hypothetical protein
MLDHASHQVVGRLLNRRAVTPRVVGKLEATAAPAVLA